METREGAERGVGRLAVGTGRLIAYLVGQSPRKYRSKVHRTDRGVDPYDLDYSMS